MMEKSFLDRPFCLLSLAAAQEITHAAHSLSRFGELHVKVGYVSTLPGSTVSWGTLPPFKQALRIHSCRTHVPSNLYFGHTVSPFKTYLAGHIKILFFDLQPQSGQITSVGQLLSLILEII